MIYNLTGNDQIKYKINEHAPVNFKQFQFKIYLLLLIMMVDDEEAVGEK